MSRRSKNPAFDKEQWLQSAPMPDWMIQDLRGISNAVIAADGCPASLDEESRNILISRARYIVVYNRAIHEDRLKQLAIADEMLSAESAGGALALMHSVYPRDRLNLDEDIKDPSDDARTRASLLYARLVRQKEMVLAEGQKEWPPYNDDLLAILKAWSVPRDEKKALAQRLILENPRSSRSKIAEMSEEFEDRKFDQSCLSQWIISGLVIDPYQHLRPVRF